MMLNLTKLFVVLPCHSLDDFPTHATGEDADSLLANWTALWHPSLITATGSAPQWVSHDFVDKDLADSLIFVPTTCSRLPEEFEIAVENENAYLVEGKTNRQQILDENIVQELVDSSELDDSIVSDFFALSYAFLQVQIMTRQLRYSTSLDIPEFEQRLIYAANSCHSNSKQHVEKNIAACFDILLEEKNKYYPTQPHLIDLVLVPPSGNLRNQLNGPHKLNICLAGNALENIQGHSKESLSILKQRVEDNLVSCTVSTKNELPIQLISIESIVNQLSLSIANQTDLLGSFSRTFAGFHQTISPQLPPILDQFQCESVVHASFVGHRVPPCSSPVINWQGSDGTNVSALTVRPIDANSHDDFLKLSLTIGEMLDSYHYAEVLLVHWPEKTCDAFDDLARCEKYGGLLGVFHTFDEFNQYKYDNGFSDAFEMEDYKTQTLADLWQRKTVDPISRWSRYWRLLVLLKSFCHALAALKIADPNLCKTENFENIRSLQNQIESSITDSIPSSELDAKIRSRLNDSDVVPIYNKEVLQLDQRYHAAINPTCFLKSIVLADSQENYKTASLESFELTNIQFQKPLEHAKDPKLIVKRDENHPPSIRNEHFEIRFDAGTGGIQSVNRHDHKGNLFSQQLSCRLSQTIMEHGFPRQKSRYAKMICKQWRFSEFGKSMASVTTEGSIVDGNESLVDYTQTVMVKRGDRNIYFEVELKQRKQISGPPWRNYIANRIAWPTEDAQIYRSENEISDRVYWEKFTAPLFVEVRSQDASICLLSGGLPFHRRSHRRMLDTLLIAGNETTEKFEFAISVDANTGVSAALEYLSPIFAMNPGDHSKLPTGWIFHLNCKNTVLTDMTPLLDKDKVVGVTLRIQESEGRPGNLKISCPRKVARANRTNFLGDPLFELSFADDIVECGFLAYQYFQIEITFAPKETD